MNTEANADLVCRAASTNGLDFYGTCTSGSPAGWLDQTLDLSAVPNPSPTPYDYRGQPNVWIALIFTSSGGTNYAEGAYVDNIVLRKCPGGTCTASAPAAASPVGFGERPASFSR